MSAPSSHYRIPAGEHRIETTVSNSRFITTISRIESVDEARAVLARVRREMPDATHHVYAFRLGHNNSVVEGMSDDGEPSGTAGAPVLAVLRGTGIGDAIIVVTRYFGGTKLGTGGLVRAYTDAARTGLSTLATIDKVARQTLGIQFPYSLYELVKRSVQRHNGDIEDEDFSDDVTIIAAFPVDSVPAFSHDVSELSAGKVQPILLADD
jgi:uncharacterized YigZ family protein